VTAADRALIAAMWASVMGARRDLAAARKALGSNRRTEK
jgi:hypothetical protein